jgi:hypothetical protein
MNGFGLEPIKIEGAPLHPYHIDRKMSDEYILAQAREYFRYMRVCHISEETLSKIALYENPKKEIL